MYLLVETEKLPGGWEECMLIALTDAMIKEMSVGASGGISLTLDPPESRPSA